MFSDVLVAVLDLRFRARTWYQSVCWIPVLLLVAFSAYAQEFFDDTGPFNVPSSSQDLDSRLADLKATEGKFPESEAIFNSEVQRLNREKDNYTAYIGAIDRRARKPDPYVERHRLAESLFRDADSLDCGSIDEGKVNALLARLSEIRATLIAPFGGEELGNPWASKDFDIKGNTPKARCEALKAALATAHRPSLLGDLDSRSGKYQKQLADDQAIRPKLKDVIDALTHRLEGMDKRSTKKDLTAYLFYLVLTIGGLSILTLLAVKTFPDAQQLEWITSGQVIQFVTVMNLLAVVMALGLVDILHENTIGTIPRWGRRLCTLPGGWTRGRSGSIARCSECEA